MSDKPRRFSWFRQIFENDKRIISCARIMSLFAAFSAFFFIFYYWWQVHQGNVVRFRETEIIDLVLYLLVASLVGWL